MAKRSSHTLNPDTVSEAQTFGDQMAGEGETGHIWKSLAASYSFLVAIGGLAAVTTGCSLVTIPIYYLLGMTAFYWWHYAAHSLHGPMHDIHMQHHKKDFPSNDYYGDKSGAIERDYTAPPTSLLCLMDPRASMTATVTHEGPLAGAMLAIVVGGRVLAHTSIPTLAVVLAGYVFMALVGSALHVSFHVRDFELEPFAWYRELRALHYVHHLQHKNFAMVNVHADQVFGSFDAYGPSGRSTQRHVSQRYSE
jgi:hypothetical protein